MKVIPMGETEASLEQQEYERLVAEGCEPWIAEMRASRSFPQVTVRNGTAYDRGRSCHAPESKGARFLYEQTKKISERLKPGCTSGHKHYNASLAEFVGDPRAWVSDANDAMRVVKARNLNIEDGCLKNTASAKDPEPEVALSEKLIKENIVREVMHDPGLAEPKKLKKLREDIITKHTPKHKRKLLKG